MKFKRLTIAALAILAFSNAVLAQQSKTDKSVEFRPHLYIQAQGGIGYSVGESDFKNLVSPSAYLSLGYRFIPALGVRIGIGGWEGKGCTVSPEQIYSWNFIQGNADLMLDLNSLFGGFNHKRTCTIYLIGGIGGIAGISNTEAMSISESGANLQYLWNRKIFVPGRFGAAADFRISDRISLNIEGNANVMSDRFNSKKAGNADWQINMLAGISYRFGKGYRQSSSYIAEKQAAEEAAKEAARVAEERKAAEKAAAEKAEMEHAAAIKAAKEKAEAEEAEAKRIAAEKSQLAAEHSDMILFNIGSDRLRKAEGEKIDNLAEWLAENQDYSITVVGYADKETGNAETNWELSRRRARNVADRLIKGGIAAGRITVDYKGDTIQPFEKAEQNRVVICTVE
ncbi:MAG: OmpA family protein [Bacteroidales bacterium]|nr:OmpA family protein [Bacteroidales bacterium]